ncbi:MAG TPA: M13 family metallopeptidase N-terminal domain-containing protein, partial [Flavobacterium sp.]|nr:M13 family metallopeptidase N-terminal domain-containing protein [Flavobacterium sp.]
MKLYVTAGLGALMTLSAVQTITAQDKPGINLSYMDKSVKPGDDFFRYVNGAWLDQTEIPADKTRWGSFDQLRETTNNDALTILKDAASKNLSSKTDQGKAANLYKTIMDTVSRNKQGIAPLRPYLSKIDAVKTVKDLEALLIEMEPEGGLGFFGIYIGTDAKDSNKNSVHISPGSLGLPDRDYYVSEDADSKEKREKYVAHVSRMLKYLGYREREALKQAQNILALETAMAQPRLDRVERRDRRKSYNPMTVAELQQLTPAINWNKYLKGVGISKVDTLIVSQPKYMTALQGLLKENKVEDWKAYMKWTLLNKNSGYLSTDIETADWEFYSKTLKGAIKEESRDKNALQTVNGNIGEALGKLYVEQKFPAEAKAKAESMIKNVMRAFENRINRLPWMAKSTRENAIQKLRKLTVKIGYPDKWKDYSALTIKSPAEGGSFFGNITNVR